MSDDTTPQPTDPHAAHRGSLPAGTPTHIGNYELLRVLGKGNFGRVYQAFHLGLERYVAIKMPIVAPESHRDFLREARIVAQLHHPNICPVYDVGEQNDLPFIVMHYVRGTLDSVLARSIPTPEQALRIAGQIAKGLEAAHASEVVHRDLKPKNVLYDENTKELFITDFGVARWVDATTTLGGNLGSPPYMAPEQWNPERFGNISARTDLYSLGVLLFRLLTGISLFPGDSPQQMFHHCFTPPRKPSEVWPLIGTRYDDLVLKALAKQPADRYASAKEFADTIAEHLHPPTTPVVVTPPSTPHVPATPEPAPAPPISVKRKAGEVIEFPLLRGLKMAFCWVPPGECKLGSPLAERNAVAQQLGEYHDWLSDESEDRRGTFSTKGFWLGKYTVTQTEWHTLTGETPSHFCATGKGASAVKRLDTTRFPVESVSWDMICGWDGFLDKLNAQPGIEKVFGEAGKFALPHEDMWEYACRGGQGNQQPFYWGEELNGTQANIDGNYPFGTAVPGPRLQRPCAVDFTNEGKYERHPWGLMHMHGNVFEWCENLNLYGSLNSRVKRGGSWGGYARFGRAARRNSHVPKDLYYVGFRCCFLPDQTD